MWSDSWGVSCLGEFTVKITLVIQSIIKVITLKHSKYPQLLCSLGIWRGNPTWLMALVMYARKWFQNNRNHQGIMRALKVKGTLLSWGKYNCLRFGPHSANSVASSKNPRCWFCSKTGLWKNSVSSTICFVSTQWWSHYRQLAWTPRVSCRKVKWVEMKV